MPSNIETGNGSGGSPEQYQPVCVTGATDSSTPCSGRASCPRRLIHTLLRQGVLSTPRRRTQMWPPIGSLQIGAENQSIMEPIQHQITTQ
uniref:Uncharacterized protein n=2 Tax=Aegilops tauschii subsp. strangulata TaxID=200361 RepID=A0A453CUQ1_AEGTS